MFVPVPTRVHAPPKHTANDIGINSLEGFIPVSLQTNKAIGIIIATTAESLTKAEKRAVTTVKTINAIM